LTPFEPLFRNPHETQEMKRQLETRKLVKRTKGLLQAPQVRSCPPRPIRYHSGLTPFDPLFRNPHLATIAGNFWRRPLDEKRFLKTEETQEMKRQLETRKLVERAMGLLQALQVGSIRRAPFATIVV
jgi:hypothetical protein